MLSRVRYSRWALLAGIAAALCATNLLLLFTADLNPGYRWVHRHFSNPHLMLELLLTGALGWAPACLMLSNLAVRQLRRDPDLRGKWIARLAILVGIPGTALLLMAIVVMIWRP
jgi:hypothetical protein